MLMWMFVSLGSTTTWTIWEDCSLVWKWCFLSACSQSVFKEVKLEKVFPSQVLVPVSEKRNWCFGKNNPKFTESSQQFASPCYCSSLTSKDSTLNNPSVISSLIFDKFALCFGSVVRSLLYLITFMPQINTQEWFFGTCDHKCLLKNNSVDLQGNQLLKVN